MPKLPNLSSKEIIKILEQNDFVLRRSSGSHQIFSKINGEKRVIIPFHNKDLPKGTLNSILKEAGISREEILNK